MGNKEVRLLAVTLLSMGKTFYFRVGNEDYRKGDLVLCETTRGIEIGKVSSDPIEKAQFSPEEYPPVLRKEMKPTTGFISRISSKANRRSASLRKKPTVSIST